MFKAPVDSVPGKKMIYQPISDVSKQKSIIASNVKVNSSTNIIKNGVTKYLQIDPHFKSKITKNYEKGGKFGSVIPKPGSEMSIKKS